MDTPRTASEWLVRLKAGNCSAEEHAAFDRWIESSPANAQAYERCAKLWSFPKALATDARLFADLAELAPPPTNQARTFLSRRPAVAAFAIAASLVCVVVGGTWYFQHTPLAEVATGPSEQRTLTLPDGSMVTLNPRTTFETSFTDKERVVELRRGEAFFNVRHEASRPFVVKAGRSLVRVVGTQFSVRGEPDRVEVVVVKGRVEVVPDATRPTGDTAPPITVPLTPGKRLEFSPSVSRVEVLNVDADQATEWRTGVVRFEATTLEEMVAQMNRYVEKPLSIEDESLRNLEVSGRFRVGDTYGLLFALRERFGIQAVESGTLIRLSADR